eukprot:gene10824-19638_t
MEEIEKEIEEASDWETKINEVIAKIDEFKRGSYGPSPASSRRSSIQAFSQSEERSQHENILSLPAQNLNRRSEEETSTTRVQQVRFKSQQGTTRSFVAKDKGLGTKPQQWKMACLFCKEDHSAVNCNKVASVQERQELLRGARRCFRCLKIGHTRDVCRSDRKCKICNGRHITRYYATRTRKVTSEGTSSCLKQTRGSNCDGFSEFRSQCIDADGKSLCLW